MILLVSSLYNRKDYRADFDVFNKPYIGENHEKKKATAQMGKTG